MNKNELAFKAAQQFSANALADGFNFEAMHEYTNEEGKTLYWRIRLKNPATNEKWIRPMHLDDKQNYVLKEPAFKNGKPLYNLHALSMNQEGSVIVCEGEWCVDKLNELGILATTSGAVDSPTKANWKLLSGRTIFLWRDNDDAGLRFAAAVIAQLHKIGCKVYQIQVEKLGLTEKGDVVDWLAQHTNVTIEDILALPNLEILNKSITTDENESEDSEDANKQTQAAALVDFVTKSNELFHDPNSEVYAYNTTTHETRRLDSRLFKGWLTANFYTLTGKVPRDQAVRETLNTLSGLARYQGSCHEVHIKAAFYDDAYYIDLAEQGKNRAIRISETGWQTVSDHPVRFLRPEKSQPLPAPCESYENMDLSSLWRIVNIPENCQLLVITWLIDCLRPDTPFPLLELIGEQGSAKSTTQRILRQLIDPNICNLRSAPKTVEDIFVNAGVGWLISYENISHLSAAMQDGLCALATGTGFSKRKLFSDADESLIVAKRPIVLNGISAAITRQDLIDRAISIEMPTINARMEITKLEKLFAAEYANILGALCTIFAKALACLKDINPPANKLPRLIEFSLLGMAIAKVLGKNENEFLTQFNANRQDSIIRVIDSNPVAAAIIEWFEEIQKKEPIIILVKDLWAAAERQYTGHKSYWPSSAKAFGDALRRAAPALRQLGIHCTSLGKRGSNVQWEVKSCDN